MADNKQQNKKIKKQVAAFTRQFKVALKHDFSLGGKGGLVF